MHHACSQLYIISVQYSGIYLTYVVYTILRTRLAVTAARVRSASTHARGCRRQSNFALPVPYIVNPATKNKTKTAKLLHIYTAVVSILVSIRRKWFSRQQISYYMVIRIALI